jgi:hypothetical protein
MSDDYEVQIEYGGAALPTVEPPAPASPSVPEEFERFEALASKLAQVSKEELDEKRQTT